MLFEKLRADDEVGADELPVRPQGAFIEKQAAFALADEPSGPRLWSPSGVEFLLHKKRELIGIGQRDNLHVAAFVRGLQAVGPQPRAQRDVLRIAKLRGRYFLAVKVRRLVDS